MGYSTSLRILKLCALVAASVLFSIWMTAASSEAAQNDEKLNHAKIIQGEGLYRVWCATCHGKTGKGDGPIASDLRPEPSDLTLLSKKNGGTFDFNQVEAIIDGRKRVPGHGSKDMPVWGDAFAVVDEEGGEEGVRQKINELVHYLRSIQMED